MADLVQVSQVEFYKQRLEVNMSSILKGADKAYLREYNESEDERRLDALQDSIGSIRKATKGGKYLGSDVIDIMVEIQGFAEKLGIDPDELEYYENQVREAQNNLESAIYGLEEPFEDAIRSLQNKIDDSQVDEMYDEKAFDNIFKDRKDKGSMEKPKSKSLPKDTGMYHQSNKAGRDKRENDNIDEEKQRLDPKCWDGYKKQGTKMKGDKRVNNCVPVKESNILKGLNESQLDEGAKEKLIALGLAGALGLGALMPSAEDSPLGKELQAAAQAGDAVAAYHLNNLDLYTDEGMARTLVNLKIAYIDDSPREDVKAFLSDPKRFPALARK
jgi:hypothetical protein